MPIKGLSDRGLAFPEIGHIRKGAPKGEKTIGQDLKYFRVEFDSADTAAQEAFLAAYPGGHPTRLNVVLPFNSIDQVWEAWLEAYTAGRLVARTDGETFVYWVDTTSGEPKVRNGLDVMNGVPVPYVEHQAVGNDYKGNPVYCRPVGRMKVVMPELKRMAFMTVLTSSKHDIINLSNQLRAIESLCLQMGKLGIGGVPLILCRRPVQISCPEVIDRKRTGKRVRREKWLLSIEADPVWVVRSLQVTKQLALPGNGLNQLMPKEPVDLFQAANDEPEEDEEDVFPFEEQPESEENIPIIFPPEQPKLIKEN